jgi:Thermophilic metalloprotease (M29)
VQISGEHELDVVAGLQAERVGEDTNRLSADSAMVRIRREGRLRGRYGVNRSKTHIDVMIGTDALEADGIRQSGKRVALVRDGAWQI